MKNIVLDCRIGLHVGEVAIGAMGKGVNTALGDAVNIAFRIEGLTRSVDKPALVSAAFLDGWDEGRAYFESCGFHEIKGQAERIEVFALRQRRRSFDLAAARHYLIAKAPPRIRQAAPIGSPDRPLYASLGCSHGIRSPMKVIERYIFGRAFVLFLGSFSATLAIIWITQALTRVNLITTNGQSVLTFLEISTLTLPSIVPEVLPFAVAIAVAQTLVTMNGDSELVVINAAGSPRSAVMRPILLLALVASLLSFVVTNVFDPYARLEFRRCSVLPAPT